MHKPGTYIGERGISVAYDPVQKMDPKALFDGLERTVGLTHDVEGVSSISIGPQIALAGMATGAKIIHGIAPNMPIYYDHKRASTHDATVAPAFLHSVRSHGVDAAGLFWLDDLQAHLAWLKAACKADVHAVVGPEITQSRRYNTGGLEMVLGPTVGEGVTTIVTRGDDPGRIDNYHDVLIRRAGEGKYKLIIARIVDKNGNIKKGIVPGPCAEFLIGQTIVDADDPRAETMKLAKKLLPALRT